MEPMSEKYYFCLNHHTVEREDGCKSADRLGPYDSAEEAARALDIAAERTAAWDNDPDWNDTGPDNTGPDDTGPDNSVAKDKPTE